MMTSKKCLWALALVALNGVHASCDEAPKVGLKDLPGIFARIEKGDNEGGFLLQFLDGGDKNAVPFLTEKLDARDSGVRLGAANALAAIGPAASPAIARLRRALKDEDESVRGGAAWALRAIGTVEAVPALVEALSIPDLDIERFAMEGLVEIGAPAKPVLESRLKEPELDEEAAAPIRQTLLEIERREAKKGEVEKSHGSLKSIKQSTPSGPAIGSLADEGPGCRIRSAPGGVIYSEGLMRLDGREIRLEYIGPRTTPFEHNRSMPGETRYDYFKEGPYLVVVEYAPASSKAMNGIDFRAVIRVSRGKETTVVRGSGECGQ